MKESGGFLWTLSVKRVIGKRREGDAVEVEVEVGFFSLFLIVLRERERRGAPIEEKNVSILTPTSFLPLFLSSNVPSLPSLCALCASARVRCECAYARGAPEQAAAAPAPTAAPGHRATTASKTSRFTQRPEARSRRGARPGPRSSSRPSLSLRVSRP